MRPQDGTHYKKHLSINSIEMIKFGMYLNSTRFMLTVYFDHKMIPEDFKKRNLNQISSYRSLCYHSDSKKPEGFPVKKGEDILSFSIFLKEESFAIQAPIDGYIHYSIDGCALMFECFYKKIKICDIYEDFNELVRNVYNNEYEFSVDEFTNEEEFQWKKVAGKSSIGFDFEKYIISFQIIDKTPYLAIGDASKPDRLMFLFGDKSILEYDLHSCIRIKNFLTLIPLNSEDLQRFLDVQLYKFRVYHSDINDTIGFERPLDVILFQLYAKHFAAILDDVGINLRSIKKDEEISENTIGECFVYLMHDTSNNFYKIGISNRPEYRERTLQSEKPTIELICAKPFPSRVIAEAIESALHKAFGDKRLRGEWFSLTPVDVDQIQITLK